jgi:hypothetical protein
MLSFIQRIVTRARAHASSVSSSVSLGRWGIQYDPKIIQIKIDQANEDHCGCCVVVNPKKEECEMAAKKKKSSVVRFEKREEYLVPYVM